MKYVKQVRSLLMLAIMFAMLGAMAHAELKTWTVNKTAGAGDFQTFAAALANPAIGVGDTIQFTDAAPVTYTEGTLDWTGKPDYIHVNVLHPGNITLTATQILAGMTPGFWDINFVDDNAATSMITLNGANGWFFNCSFSGVKEWHRGVDIAGGTTNFVNCTFDGKNEPGGWVMMTFIDWAATVNFSKCTFKDMQCTAVWLRGSTWLPEVDPPTVPPTYGDRFVVKSNVTVDQCTFTNVAQVRDTAVPAFKMMAGTLTVTSSTINLGEGYLLAQDPEAENYSSALIASDVLNASFTNCKVSKPHVDVPVITPRVAPSLNVSFGNCIFDAGDSVAWDMLGTAEATKSTFKFDHCLLMQNFTGWGAAIQSDAGTFGTFEIKNSIIEAVNEGIHLGDVAQLSTASDCNLLNKFGYNDTNFGAHSLDGRTTRIDPLFVDAAKGDFHLQYGSPCINKGVPTSLTFDFFNNPRPMPAGSNSDIGIHEFNDSITAARGEWTLY